VFYRFHPGHLLLIVSALFGRFSVHAGESPRYEDERGLVCNGYVYLFADLSQHGQLADGATTLPGEGQNRNDWV